MRGRSIMSNSHKLRGALIATALVLVGCIGPGGSPSPTAGTPLKVGLGYIPSVQFAPFYLAQQSGAYAAAGLDVELQNQIDPDLISLVGSGGLDLALADGTSMIPAVSQGIPVQYLATIYGTLPNVVIARADRGIASPADLAGHSVGTPGQYGSGYLTLLGILADAGLALGDKPREVQLKLYPDFGQTQALISGAVDAVTGYANNDLVTAEAEGLDVNVFFASSSAPFAGPGLISAKATLASKGDAVRAFIAVTLDAMRQIAADPELGVNAAGAIVPELIADAAARERSLSIMRATIEIWSGPAQDAAGYGALDETGWEQSIDFMRELKGQTVSATLTAADILDAGFLPK